MSLAARCPACGTVFRVVQDQLRVSEGWVRCGRCAEVFNAIENLVDLEADLPAPARPRAPVAEDRPRVPAERAPSGPPPAAPAPAEPPPAVAAARVRHDETPAEAELAAEYADVDSTLLPEPLPEHSPEAAVDVERPAAPPPPPPFVRRAERAARWRRPGIRAALAALAGVAALLLLAQIGLTSRDSVAARWPALQPALEALCGGCRIEPPRAIESLAVESSGLVRVEGTAMYRLSVVLANRSPRLLAVPALDLTLTDTQGGVIARRVLTAAELGVTAGSVPGRAELPIQATLQVAERTVSGYTIEIFYP
jgi:predicted Zn finger-like uncharacterized protein